MKYQIHVPCDQLRPYVKQLVISETEDANIYKILPGTSLVIGFQYRGGLAYLNEEQVCPLSTAGITGLLDGCRLFQNTADVGTVLVVFQENGAARILRSPLNELFGQSLSLEHFFDHQQLAEFKEKLAFAMGDTNRIKLVEQFLIKHLNAGPADLLVNRALAYIHQSKGTIRMDKLASLLHTSSSPLEKRFRREVGASPKKFATIVRAQNVLAALEKGHQNYAEYLSAYYDQAHFIKDFKKFAGFTPQQYLKHMSNI